MAKGLTPYEAYKRVAKMAAANNMSVSAWAEAHGVGKGTVSHWRQKRPKTVLVSTLERLGIHI